MTRGFRLLRREAVVPIRRSIYLDIPPVLAQRCEATRLGRGSGSIVIVTPDDMHGARLAFCSGQCMSIVRNRMA